MLFIKTNVEINDTVRLRSDDGKLTSSFISRSSSGGNFLPPRNDRLLSNIDDGGLFDLAMVSPEPRNGTVLLFIDMSVFDGETPKVIWDSSSDFGDVPSCSSCKIKAIQW